MESQIETGRRLVVAVIVASLALSLVVIGTFNLVRGPERLPQQVVRFLLAAGLCAFLYRGANWARRVAGILFATGALGSLVVGLPALPGKASLLPLATGLVYLASAVVLLFVPAVQAYFGAERANAR